MAPFRVFRSGVIASVVTLALAGCGAPSVESLLEKANVARQKGDAKGAAITLKRALSEDGKNAEAFFQIGTLFAQVGSLLDAENALRRSLELGKAPAAVLPVLGQVLVDLEKFPEVIGLVKADTKLGRKESAQLAVIRGRAYLGQGALLEARTQFHLAQEDATIDAKLGLAQVAAAEKNRALAHSLVEEAIATDKTSSVAWFAKGELLRGEGKIKEAIAALEEAMIQDPDAPRPMATLAVLHIGNGDDSTAAPLLAHATHVAPMLPLVNFANGLLAYREKRYEDARAYLQTALEAVPNYMPAILLAGSLNFATEQYELAQNSFVAYLTNEPGNVGARKMLASTLIAKGQAHFAVNVLEPLLEGAKDAELLAIASNAHLKVNRIERAKALLERAIALDGGNADYRTSLGALYMAAGQRDRAITEFDAAIAMSPKTARAEQGLVTALLAKKDLARAEKAVENLQKRLPGLPETHALRGAVLEAKKDPAGARASFERAVAIDAAHMPAVNALSAMDLRDGRKDGPRKRFEAVLKQDRTNLDALLALAEIDIAAGKAEDAIAWIRLALTDHQRSLRALMALAQIQFRAGKLEDASTTVRLARDSHPWDTAPLELLADIQLAGNDLQGAILSLTTVTTLRPGVVAPYLRIAMAHLSTGDTRTAISMARKATEIDGKSMDARAVLGEVLLRAGRIPELLEVAQQTQKDQPREALGFAMEGEALLAKGDATKAMASFQKADALRPSGDLRVKIHRAQTAQAGKAAPVDALRDWVKRNPADVETRLYMADVLANNGAAKEAVEHYDVLLKAARNDFRVLNNAAWAMLQVGDRRALETAQQAVKIRPDDAFLADTLGVALMAEGKIAEAVQVLLKASSMNRDHPEIRFHLAQALLKVGDQNRAKQELKAVVSGGRAFPQLEQAKALLAQLGP